MVEICTPVTITTVKTMTARMTSDTTPRSTRAPKRTWKPAKSWLNFGSLPCSTLRLASIRPAMNTGHSTLIAIGPMKGTRCPAMAMTKSASSMPIHVPAAGRKSDHAEANQVQPLPIGTPRAAALNRAPPGTVI